MQIRWFQKAFKRIVQKRMQQLLHTTNVTVDYEPMHLVLPESDEPSLAMRLVAALTLEEKIDLLCGVDEFCIPGVPRLGLKPIWTSDSTMGIRGAREEVTDFPCAVSMAASFNGELVEAVGQTIAQECRALGIGILLAPGVNLARVPICGRNFEYFGEDPYLAGEMAAKYIEGVSHYPVITTVKHFACNNSEYDRHKSNSVVDERSLRELYLPAFKRAIDAGSLGLMTSYNQVNGTYTSEHPYLLGNVLRGEWQFEGLVISDWNSLYSTDAVLSCGVDVEMPLGKYLERGKVQDALKHEIVPEKVIDERVYHLLSSYEKAGLLNASLADASFFAGSPEHRKQALAVALESVVLLKNVNNALPLSVSDSLCLGGSNAIKVSQGGGSSMIQWKKKPQNLADVLGAGATLLPPRWYHSRSWRKKVKTAKSVVLVVGFDNIEESEAYDRPWSLSRCDEQSILIASSLQPRTIVVVQSGGAIDMMGWESKVAAILQAGYLGSSTAHALKALLYGEVSPSGKLPYTIAKHIQDYKSMRGYPKDYSTTNIARIKKGQGDPDVRCVSPLEYTEGLLVGYRQFDTEGLAPLFCFGHGLAYTTFAYGPLGLEKGSDGSYLVQLTIANTGKHAAAEVVQLYVHPLESVVFRPYQELKGFKKVFLGVGEQGLVQLSLPLQAFQRWSLETGGFVCDPGLYELRVGSSSRDIRCTTTVRI